jgi:hypothetical protein
MRERTEKGKEKVYLRQLSGDLQRGHLFSAEIGRRKPRESGFLLLTGFGRSKLLPYAMYRLS